MSFFRSISGLALVATAVQGLSLPTQKTSLFPRQSGNTNGSTSVCAGNTAADRSVWCDYNTSTNYYDTEVDTGVTVEYWFELANITAAPDGVARNVLTVNGSIPGPTIEANWGDTVKIHLTNSLANNGTSLHFHGIRQVSSSRWPSYRRIT